MLTHMPQVTGNHIRDVLRMPDGAIFLTKEGEVVTAHRLSVEHHPDTILLTTAEATYWVHASGGPEAAAAELSKKLIYTLAQEGSEGILDATQRE